MVLSRGLLFSLGFTSLTSILLFLFIKQKTSSIETKINTLFNLVQEEASKSHQRQLQQKQQNMIISEIPQQSQNRLIQVSDDEESEEESDEESVIDSDDDIQSDTDSDEEDSDEEDDQENNLGQQSGGTIDLLSETDEIKKVNIQEILGEDTDAKIADTENKLIHLTKQSPENEDSDEDDSDEDDSDEDIDSDLESEPEELSFIEDNDEDTAKENTQQIGLDKLSDVASLVVSSPVLIEDPSNVGKSSNVEEVKEIIKITPTEEVVNYNKLSVKVLKEIVASKGLHAEPSKLKKKELLKLLK